jgi:hypothetical protein
MIARYLFPLVVIAFVVLSSPSSTIASHGCTDGTREFVCGQVVVTLIPDADEIEVIIERNGGSAADLDHTYRSAGGATGDDTFYVINVPVGQEVAAEQEYGDDPDVFLATVNQEELGHTTPNTALPVPADAGLPLALAAVGALMALGVGIRRLIER